MIVWPIHDEWSRAGLGRISGSEDVADFPDGFHAFIDKCNATFAAGLAQSASGTSEARRRTYLTMVSNWLSPNTGPRMLPSSFRFQRKFEAEFFSNEVWPCRRTCPWFGAENFADGAVEFHRLCHAHVVQLDADDE